MCYGDRNSAPALHSGAINSFFFCLTHTVCPFLSSEWAEEVDASEHRKVKQTAV